MKKKNPSSTTIVNHENIVNDFILIYFKVYWSLNPIIQLGT